MEEWNVFLSLLQSEGVEEEVDEDYDEIDEDFNNYTGKPKTSKTKRGKAMARYTFEGQS
jgi:hypothetical protein